MTGLMIGRPLRTPCYGKRVSIYTRGERVINNLFARDNNYKFGQTHPHLASNTVAREVRRT